MRTVTDDDTPDVISAGDSVLIDVNGDKLFFIKLQPKATVVIGGHVCDTTPLVGAAFGSAFLLDEDKKLQPVETNPHDELFEAEGTERGSRTIYFLEVEVWLRNIGPHYLHPLSNASIFAGETTQLAQDEVERLKMERHGAEIIAALESGSSSFAAKTEFSQEKWRKRKAKKYLHYITVRQPTSELICDAYFKSTPIKVFNMRPDTLAVMMHAADIGPHAEVLCIDATVGVVAAGAIERMGGFGTLCCAHVEPKRYILDAPRLLNRPRWLVRCARHVPLADLLRAARDRRCVSADVSADDIPAQHVASTRVSVSTGTAALGHADVVTQEGGEGQEVAKVGNTAPGVAEAACAPRVAVKGAAVPQHCPAGPGSACTPCSSNTHGSIQKNTPKDTTVGGPDRVVLRLHEDPQPHTRIPEALMPCLDADLRLVAERGFSSVLIAAPRLDYAALLPMLLPLMRPSAAIAVYSPSPQPLAECFQALQATQEVISLQIQEPWWREIQVLPSRTHPQMSAPGTGGFLLTGIRVLADSKIASNDQGRARKRRRRGR